MALLAKSMKPSELAVSIVFDEMATKKHLDYNKALDKIDGLTSSQPGHGVNGSRSGLKMEASEYPLLPA